MEGVEAGEDSEKFQNLSGRVPGLVGDACTPEPLLCAAKHRHFAAS